MRNIGSKPATIAQKRLGSGHYGMPNALYTISQKHLVHVNHAPSSCNKFRQSPLSLHAQNEYTQENKASAFVVEVHILPYTNTTHTLIPLILLLNN
jgi:hypothetical protein